MLKHRFYYAIKPILPRPLRISVRRFVAERVARQCGHIWPINPSAAQPPVNWPGWPDKKRFAVVLTHDVEGSSGLDRCLELADLEASLGFRSSFNFIPEGSYRVPHTLRQQLIARGFEVGVHDLRHDGSLYRNREEFRRNAERINRYLREWNAVGFRSGFMYHNLEWLQDLEVQYDASTFDTDPFEPQPDGANTIFPFWTSRENEPNGAGYVELPYTLSQDSTLFIILQQPNIEIWTRKLAWIVQHGGMALVNVHPDYLHIRPSSKSAATILDFYREFLQHIRNTHKDSYWHVLPKDVASFVRNHRHSPAAASLTP